MIEIVSGRTLILSLVSMGRFFVKANTGYGYDE